MKEKVKEVLNKQKLGVLATTGDIYPCTSLVAVSHSQDLKVALFATLRNTRKYINIQNNPDVTILVDNRTNTEEDFEHAVALTIMGRAQEIASEQVDEYRELFLAKHPSLRTFVDDPDCALISLIVSKYVYVSQFQEITEVDMS
ncbi:MAG: pyridoxamine 5'-phosphate oxidase family protein [Candidatus Ancaeobacter aquaticus]|nr:pyridoxamine 5'-phosphate oxidase family protein [Candidatus Ancaeobacter aquaticus]